MPSERFSRLPEQKKQIIRQAAIQEFARVPYDKASINRIVRIADISRGSFYTYFEDKKDILKWLFEDGSENLERYCRDSLQKSGGDYFRMLEDVFDYVVGRFREAKEMILVAKNVLANSETAAQLGFEFCPRPNRLKDGESLERRMFGLIDRDQLKCSTVEEFEPLATLGGMALVTHIRQFYDDPDHVEEIRQMFRRTLDMLRYGCCSPRTVPDGTGRNTGSDSR